MPNQIRKEDIADLDFVDAYELQSDGYSNNHIYLSGVSVVSTTALTKTIVINLAPDGGGILYSKDHPVESKDIVYLSGTSGGTANGFYTVDQVLSDTSFTVNESISNSTGGSALFKYPSGASKVGFDSRLTNHTNADNLQQAVQDIDNNLLSSDEHPTLRQLIHFIDEGPGDGFISGATKIISPPGLFPTSIIWYTDNNLNKKIVEQTIIWSGIVPSTITWQVYNVDGTTVAHAVSDSITYVNSIFESSRTRTIT